MSQNDPEVLRAEIARTRAELSDNVDTLTETANPKNIANRQVTKVKSAARGVREHLMGAPDDPDDSGTLGDKADAVKDRVGAVGDRASNTLGSVQDRASGALDTVSDAPAQVRRKARGNPLAAGLIAFGIGYLIAGAIPSSQKEQHAANRLQDKGAPLKDKLSEAAGEIGDRLREPAQEAVASVKGVATTAAANVKDEGVAAKDAVQEQSLAAKDNVQGQVQDSTSTVKTTQS
jgi:hypothetical protein